MKMKWFPLTLIAVGLVSAQLAACAKFLESRNAADSSATLAPSQSAIGDLTERDFSESLELCHPSWVDSVSSQERPTLNWKLARRPEGLGGLSHAQQLQLGGYIAPNGKYVDILRLLLTIDRFENEVGRRPYSGLEIVGWLQEGNPKLAKVDLTSLSPESMPAWFYKFVNPQTGKLYESFDGSVPEPGGIQLRDFVDADDCKRSFAGRPGWDRCTNPRVVGGCEIIVLDSDASKVLDTATTLKSVDLETEEAAPVETNNQGSESHSHPHM